MGVGAFMQSAKQLKNGVEEVGDKVKEAIKKKLDEIEEFMKTPDL